MRIHPLSTVNPSAGPMLLWISVDRTMVLGGDPGI